MSQQSAWWRRIWQGWRSVARKIGDFQARVLLTVLYYVVFAPFALLVNWSGDPLSLNPKTPKGWRPRSTSNETEASRATRQY